MTTHRMTDSETIKNFLTAGNATLTLKSGKTGAHYTYKIRKLDKKDTEVWFISLLIGANNESDYAYMAYFNGDMKIKLSAKSKTTKDSKPFLAINYLFEHLDNVPEQLEVLHNGKCCRCGRTLTTPESIELGIGPECYKKRGAM